MPRDYWTDERVDFLKLMWGKVSASRICEALEEFAPPAPSRNAVIGKAERLGLERISRARSIQYVHERRIETRQRIADAAK